MPQRFIPADKDFPYDRIFLRKGKDENGDPCDIYLHFEKVKKPLRDKKTDHVWTRKKIIQWTQKKLMDDAFNNVLMKRANELKDEEYFDNYFQRHSFD